MARKLIGGMALGAILVALVFGFSTTVLAEGETLPRAVAEWPLSTGDVNRASYTGAASDMMILGLFMGQGFSTGEGDSQALCFGDAFTVSGAADSFDLSAAGGFGLYMTTAEEDALELFQSGAWYHHLFSKVMIGYGAEDDGSFVLTDWDENPGAGTYYVHIGPTLQSAAGVVWGAPAFTVGTSETVAGSTLLATVTIVGSETKSEDYTIEDACQRGGDEDEPDPDCDTPPAFPVYHKASTAGDKAIYVKFSASRIGAYPPIAGHFAHVSTGDAHAGPTVTVGEDALYLYLWDDDDAAVAGSLVYVDPATKRLYADLEDLSPWGDTGWIVDAGLGSSECGYPVLAVRHSDDPAGAGYKQVLFDEDGSSASEWLVYTSATAADTEITFAFDTNSALSDE